MINGNETDSYISRKKLDRGERSNLNDVIRVQTLKKKSSHSSKTLPERLKELNGLKRPQTKMKTTQTKQTRSQMDTHHISRKK